MPKFRRILLGRRLATEESHHAKISNPIALAVFSSDNLSSVAYATGEIMAVLAPAMAAYGAGILTWSWPVAIGIVTLLVMLTVSYRQTIFAYPGGGGAYIVAKENLGELPAQVAGASLLVDYILTVAVSISAGITALTSAFPELDGIRVFLALLVIAFVAMMNLRGVKESGVVFAVPTYGFVVCMVALIGFGFFRYFAGGTQPAEHHAVTLPPMAGWAGLWLFARAYSAGCTALTGVEAISNGVGAFREPTSSNAAKTLIIMVTLLGSMFLGVTWLANHYGITFDGTGESLLSKLARAIIGGDTTRGGAHLAYLAVQGFTMLILLLAANTAYADFPRLAAMMGKDGYVPRQFSSQGDRLVFSNGILILSALAGLLVILFHAREHHLLPLYAVGVFLGFTLSQFGMVLHWMKERGPRWPFKAFLNGLGGATSCVVMVVIAITKFTHGAWVVILLIPIMVALFYGIHRHYIRVKAKLASSRTDHVHPRKNRVIVLVSGIHHGVIHALSYAKSIAVHGDIEALVVDFPDEHGHESPALLKLRSDWPNYCEGVPLRAIHSPYRKIVGPILQELDRIRRSEPEVTTTVIIPEFVTTFWWESLLHNQTALRIKTSLLRKPKTVVISVPYHVDVILD